MECYQRGCSLQNWDPALGSLLGIGGWVPQSILGEHHTLTPPWASHLCYPRPTLCLSHIPLRVPHAQRCGEPCLGVYNPTDQILASKESLALKVCLGWKSKSSLLVLVSMRTEIGTIGRGFWTQETLSSFLNSGSLSFTPFPHFLSVWPRLAAHPLWAKVGMVTQTWLLCSEHRVLPSM